MLPTLPISHTTQLKNRLTTQYCAASRPHKYIGKNFWLTKNKLFGSDLQATNVFCYAAAMLYVSTVRLVPLNNPAAILVNSFICCCCCCCCCCYCCCYCCCCCCCCYCYCCCCYCCCCCSTVDRVILLLRTVDNGRRSR